MHDGLSSSKEPTLRFKSVVEPPEPMRGLQVPFEIVEALKGGGRPRVIVTINGHSWRSRLAIMRGRNLIGVSNANRKAAGIRTGDEVEVQVELDLDSRDAVEPADIKSALDAEPLARHTFDRLTESQKREQIRTIEAAKKPGTRIRRISSMVTALIDA